MCALLSFNPRLLALLGLNQMLRVAVLRLMHSCLGKYNSPPLVERSQGCRAVSRQPRAGTGGFPVSNLVVPLGGLGWSQALVPLLL